MFHLFCGALDTWVVGGEVTKFSGTSHIIDKLYIKSSCSLTLGRQWLSTRHGRLDGQGRTDLGRFSVFCNLRERQLLSRLWCFTRVLEPM